MGALEIGRLQLFSGDCKIKNNYSVMWKDSHESSGSRKARR